MTEPWIALVVLVPVVGAVLALIAGRRAAWVAVPAAVASLAASAALVHQVATAGPIRYAVGGWPVPLGIALRADGLAALMIAAVAVVGTGATVYATRRAATGAPAAPPFHALWLFAWAGLAALALSADLFNLYVTLELITLAAVALIARSGARGALIAALRYVLYALVGSAAYLVGVVLLYAHTPTLDLARLGAALEPGPIAWTAFAFITAGLAFKSALFPLHGWLPAAYAGAPSASAVVLAALIGKASFYVLLRVWFDVFAALPPLAPGVVLGVLGSAAIAWCSALAIRERRLRRVLAYSGLGQIGYLFLAFALATPAAIAGAAYLVISHAAAKAAMFMAVGDIERTIGSDDVGELAGLARKLPVTFFTLGLAGMTLLGLPPSGGFVAKWLLVRASLETGQWWWAVVLIAGGFLAAAYVFRIIRLAFSPVSTSTELAPGGTRADPTALALALLSIVLGLVAAAPLALLGLEVP